MNLKLIVYDVIELAEKVGWKYKEKKIASTGSTYIDFSRTLDNETEYVTIRVANHKQFYQGWIIEYSVSPGNLYFEELEDVLTKEFGKVGDIL